MKCVNNPSLQHSHIINENLVGVEKQKLKQNLTNLYSLELVFWI